MLSVGYMSFIRDIDYGWKWRDCPTADNPLHPTWVPCWGNSSQPVLPVARSDLSMSSQIAYRLEEVQKILGEFVLRIHQLDIQQGESFCVLGPTGSGKTTLLRILSGLEVPTEGDVCFGSRMET